MPKSGGLKPSPLLPRFEDTVARSTNRARGLYGDYVAWGFDGTDRVASAWSVYGPYRIHIR